MKFLHFLFGLFLVLVLLVVSVQVIVNASVFPGLWRDLLEWMAVRRLWVLGGAVATLAALVLYVLTGSSRPKQEQFITFDNEGGSVSVSVKAIRDLLSRLGEEFAAVLSLDPVIRAQSGSMEVDLQVRIRSGTQIPELSKLLQEKVKEQVRDVLGFPDVKAVRIHVREIVADGGAKVAKKPSGEPAPEWEETMRL